MTGSAIARRDLSIDDLTRLAKAFATSGYFDDARDVAQAFVKISTGHELGIAPMTAMSEIHIIKGKPTLGAGALAALVKAHPAYDYRLLEHTAERCAIEFFTLDPKRESLGVSEFTIDDAKTAGLTSSQMYTKFPRNMLFARAISNGVGWYCPDVTMGRVYTPDELADDGSEARGAFDVEAVAVEGPSREALEAAEPADIALWQLADRLTADITDPELLEAAASNRRLNDDDPAAHVQWLEQHTAAPVVDDPAAPMASAAQKKKLGVLVGRLRDGVNLTTAQLYLAVGRQPDVGDDGVPHFGPLLQTLTKDEAHLLIDRLEKYETKIAAAQA